MCRVSCVGDITRRGGRGGSDKDSRSGVVTNGIIIHFCTCQRKFRHTIDITISFLPIRKNSNSTIRYADAKDNEWYKSRKQER